MRRDRQTAHLLFHKLNLEMMSTKCNRADLLTFELEASCFRLLFLAYANTKRAPGG